MFVLSVCMTFFYIIKGVYNIFNHFKISYSFENLCFQLIFEGMNNMDDFPPLLCGSQALTCSPASPRKAGAVYMIQGRRKVRVRLSVHHKHFEQYVVVSQERLLCKDCGFINLRNCTIKENGENCFQILPKDCDGNILTFAVSTPQEVKDWLQVLNMGRSERGSPQWSTSALRGSQVTSSNRSLRKINHKRHITSLPALAEE